VGQQLDSRVSAGGRSPQDHWVAGQCLYVCLCGDHLPRILDFHFRPQTNVERVQHLHRPFQRNAEVFVALVSRHLRFMHTKSLGQFSLGDSLRNAQRDQQSS
jgi:hypothetical protein